MNDDSGQASVWYIEENCGEGVDGKEDDDSGDDSSKRCSYTSFGLDGCSRKGASRRICAQKRTKQVCDTNGNQFLRRINGVIVDTTKRFRYSDMLNQKDNDTCWKLANESANDVCVDSRHCRVLEASGDGAKDGKFGLASVIAIDQPADHSIEQDDKRGSKSGDEEKCLLPLGDSSCEITTQITIDVEQ